jgi:hypothetical protein
VFSYTCVWKMTGKQQLYDFMPIIGPSYLTLFCLATCQGYKAAALEGRALLARENPAENRLVSSQG